MVVCCTSTFRRGALLELLGAGLQEQESAPGEKEKKVNEFCEFEMPFQVNRHNIHSNSLKI